MILLTPYVYQVYQKKAMTNLTKENQAMMQKNSIHAFEMPFNFFLYKILETSERKYCLLLYVAT